MAEQLGFVFLHPQLPLLPDIYNVVIQDLGVILLRFCSFYVKLHFVLIYEE